MATKFVSTGKLSLAVTKLKELISGKVSKTGDTMTGDLTVGSATVRTNGYLEGTWLKTNAVINKGSQTGKVAVIDESGWIYYRTPKEITDEAGVTNTYTCNTSTSWTKNSSGYYTQTISVSGITANDNPIIDIVTDVNNYANQLDAWGKIFKITTAANSMTVYATEAISIALLLQIKVVR